MNKSPFQELADKLEGMERRIAALEAANNTSPVGPGRQPWKYAPPYFNCPTCGIELHSVMNYVCSNVDCPVGLGPTVTC